jgi:hypothetical protein
MIALFALAHAADLPPRPPPPESVEGDCSRSVPLVPGKPVPAFLVTAGLVTCSAVAVPTAEAADLLAIEAWSEHVADRYRIDTAALESEIAIARGETAWWKAQAERPVPLLQRPGVGLAVGAGIGALSVVLGGLAVRAVGEAPLFTTP